MSHLFRVEPEVSGELGDKSIILNCENLKSGADFIPRISNVEYIFTVWLGDDLVAGDGGFLITSRVFDAIKKNRLTGAKICDIDITLGDYFEDMMADLHPDAVFPEFMWLEPEGVAEVMSNGLVIKWSSHDFCWGVNIDYVQPKLIAPNSTGLPRYFLVISKKALEVLQHFELNNCEITLLNI